MAYNVIDRRGEQNIKQDDIVASKRFVIERKPDTNLFYELEEAVVLDVILDETHPEVQKSKIDPENWPSNIDGSEPKVDQKNYSLIGRIKFRFLNSQINVEKELLNWALPIENTGVVEYPLMNEIVIVGKYRGQFFYSRKLNINSLVNSNAVFYAEKIASREGKNINEYDSSGNYSGPTSKINYSGGPNYSGILGSSFKFNPKIRTLKHYEGDTIIQSRFGSSIRFGAYDHNQANNNGEGEYSDGGGNPMILIRNRQAKIQNSQGNSAKGYTLEDINKDGSSIHITSGKTISPIVPTTSTPIQGGKAQFKVPTLKGDQIVINSDRLVFSSRVNEMLFFSKKTIGMATDQEVLVTAAEKIVFSTKKMFTVNAPQIFLGDHGSTQQPAVLGTEAVFWLGKLIDSLNNLINTNLALLTALDIHAITPAAIPPLPHDPKWEVTSIPIQASYRAVQASLQGLSALRTEMLSSRVYVNPKS